MEGARASLVKGKRVGGSSEEGGYKTKGGGLYRASSGEADVHANRCGLDVE